MSDETYNETDWNNASIVIRNSPPTFNSSNSIGILHWTRDNNKTLIMPTHVYDIDEDDVNYTAIYPDNVTVIINNVTKNITLVPELNWTGTSYITIYAIDTENANATSGNLTIHVTYCGNNIVEYNEECDGGSGCTSYCQTESVPQQEGGGGAAPTPEPIQPCSQAWSCTSWSPSTCPSSGTQTRSCSCGCPSSADCTGSSSTSRTCSYTPPPPAVAEPAWEETIIEEEFVPTEEEVEARVERPVSVSSQQVNVGGTACTNVTQRISTKSLATTKTDIDPSLLPEGYSIVIDPFNIDCEGDTMDLTLNIPDNYVDVQVLKCSGGVCVPSISREIERIECGETVTEVVRAEKYLKPELFAVKIEEVEKEISLFNESIESGGYSLRLLSSVGKITVKLDMPKEEVEQTASETLMMIGTPLIVKLDRKVSARAEVTLPFITDPEVDRNTIQIYGRTKEGWQPLAGTIDEGRRLITAEIEDIAEYLNENNEAEFVLVGVICISCEQSSFEKIYSPPMESKAAVLLIHGLGSSPATFRGVIDDIRWTQQPWQVWAFAYPSDKKTFANAKELADNLEKHVNEYEDLYTVGHSLGGIVLQKALSYAYLENKKNPENYTFINKIRRAILVATPNDKVKGTQVFQNIFRYYVNLHSKTPMFDANSTAVIELLEGAQVPKVPFIKYYVIAGTKGYEFNAAFFTITTEELAQFYEKNDGLITVSSAQHVGGTYINDTCEDYWEIYETHTDIIDNPVTRKVVEGIIAEEVAKDYAEKALIGNNKFIKLAVERCSQADKYIVVGRYVEEEAVEDITGCSCGNNVCGIGENEVNCPSDCLKLTRQQEVVCSNTMMWFILVNFALLTGLTGVIIYRSSRRKIFRLFIRWAAGYTAFLLLLSAFNILLCGFHAFANITQAALTLVICLGIGKLYRLAYKGILFSQLTWKNKLRYALTTLVSKAELDEEKKLEQARLLARARKARKKIEEKERRQRRNEYLRKKAEEEKERKQRRIDYLRRKTEEEKIRKEREEIAKKAWETRKKHEQQALRLYKLKLIALEKARAVRQMFVRKEREEKAPVIGIAEIEHARQTLGRIEDRRRAEREDNLRSNVWSLIKESNAEYRRGDAAKAKKLYLEAIAGYKLLPIDAQNQIYNSLNELYRLLKKKE